MRGNLHTHSLYCDGNDTLREIVESAIEKNFDYIGFSGHSYTPFDTRYCMSEDNTKRYFEEVNALKKEYRNKIKIYCGIEKDFYSLQTENHCDFEIGSVHYLYKDGVYLPVDESAEDILKATDDAFGGDVYAFVKCYFETVSKLESPIIGHFDLVTKFNDTKIFFSEENPEYKKAALCALEKLLLQKSVFEVNTGAMARGMKNTPYPSEWILKEIKKRGGRVILTSDCHCKDKLDFAFSETEEMLKRLGFENYFKIPR